MALDFNKELRRAVDTGKVLYGREQAEKSILKGSGQLIVISGNAQKQVRDKIRVLSEVGGIPYYDFNGTGIELGSVCGKPFVVSVMLVLEKGKSKVLEAVKA